MELTARLLVETIKGMGTRKVHCVTLIPNSVHLFPKACRDRYDGFEARVCLSFSTFQCEDTLPRDGSPKGLESREEDVRKIGR